METVKLNNGIEMPVLGYGVYQVSPDEAERCVSDALSVGYRLIDTAQAYFNEDGVGRAIKKSGISRDKIFLTTKVWISNCGYEKTRKSIENSLKRLDTDYIDLMLYHMPYGDYYGSFRAMEDMMKEGRLRAVGVSNFYSDRLIDLCHYTDTIPAVNQLETHVFSMRKDIRETMDKLGIVQESWGPFAEGKNDIFNNSVLQSVATKHGKTSAQVALRYLIEKGIVVIPKSTHKNRMEQNFSVFDFKLDDEDKTVIDTLDTGKPLIMDHRNPAVVDYCTSWENERNWN